MEQEQAAPTTVTGPEPVAGPWHITLLKPLRERLTSWPALLPKEEGEPIRPLAIGADRALIGLLINSDENAIELVHSIMRLYCMSSQYVAAMSRDGAMRYDLEGNPVEVVTEADRQQRQISWLTSSSCKTLFTWLNWR